MATNEIFTSPPQWNDSFPDDRIAHLLGGVMRAFGRALQTRLAAHGMPIGY